MAGYPNAQHGFAAIGAEEYVFNLLPLIINMNKVKLWFSKFTY